MGALARFFGGMSWQGYVITALLSAVMFLSIGLGWALSSRDDLRTELANSEAAVLTLVDTATHNAREVDRLINEVAECTNKRAAAEKSALEVEKELHRLASIVEGTTRERTEQIQKDVESSDPRCDCVVPPRTTSMLIGAACSANRDANCP